MVSLCCLSDYLGRNSRIRFPIPREATLAELRENDGWRIPPARSENQVQVITFLLSLSTTNCMDSYEWMPGGVAATRFSTGLIYKLLCDHDPEVVWHKQVWFSGGIPRHMFLTWLVTLNRCPTRDRFIHWGLPRDPACLLCQSAPEPISHIYFECPFSWQVWESAAPSTYYSPSRQWLPCLNQLVSFTGTRTQRTLLLLYWHAVIYFLWKERNNRLHRQHFSSAPQTLIKVRMIVKDRISSLRQERPVFSSQLSQLYFANRLLLLSLLCFSLCPSWAFDLIEFLTMCYLSYLAIGFLHAI